MSRRLRRIWTISLTLLALATGAAAVSWACTPAAYLTLDRSSGPAGTAVAATGNGFAPGPVQISWNGTVVGTATGPSFTTTVTIPAAAPGVYYLQAVARRPDGVTVGQASRAFRLTAPAARAPAAAEPPVVRLQEPQGVSRRAAPSPQGGPKQAPAPAPRRAEAEAHATPSPPAATAVPVRRAEAAKRAATGSRVRTPSTDDLWNGFEGDGGFSSGGAAAPRTSGPGLGAGIALLALGLVALMGGCAVAVAPRRQAL